MCRETLEQLRKVQHLALLKRWVPFVDCFRSLDEAGNCLHPFWWSLLKGILLFHLDVKVLLIILQLCIYFIFVILPSTASDCAVIIVVPLVAIDLARGEVGDTRYTESASKI